MSTKFYTLIKQAKDEKSIEKVYENEIEKYFKNTFITHPYECDGYAEQSIMYDEQVRVLRLIMEFKYGKNFNIAFDRATVLVQVLYYLKKFQLGLLLNYKELPNIILAGDKTTCFVIHAEQIKKYLDYPLNWNIAPSSAPLINKNLVKEISEDTDVKIHVFDIKSDFQFKNVVVEIKRLLINLNSKLRVTENNIAEIYDYFIEKVIRNPQEYTAQDLVYFFINVITDNIDTFLHAKKKDILYVRDEHNIKIDTWSYNYFVENYSTRYSPSEEDKFNEVKDRLIEDTSRRYNGEFYTPTTWVNEAHKEINKILGQNWKNEYVVWDCAWGTGNLTRDYYFENLFCSTLNESDLRLGEKYNLNNYKFKYDFLNDGICNNKLKIPKEIEDAILDKKKLVFLINPPFAEASNGKVKNRSKKDGTSKTKIKTMMEIDNLKSCSQQLYAQFIYRMMLIKEKYDDVVTYICMFAPLLYLTGPRFDKFRERFLLDFNYESGFMFNASYFSDVSNQWEVSFSIWSSGKNVDNNNFKFIIKEMNEKGNIIDISSKKVYNLPKEKRCSNWIKTKSKDRSVETIILKSALNCDSKIANKSKDTIGYLMNDSNNVYANTQGVYILSCPVTRHIKTTPITKDNYRDCFSLFTARRLVKSNWLNQKEEYCIPNVNNPKYEEWLANSVIYSIFENSAMSSSLRNIEINRKKYNVFNEMFFMSNNEIKKLADTYNNYEVYNDCKMFSKERFLYCILKDYNLTPWGEKLLNKAREIIIKTFEFRENFNIYKPEYYTNTWDAGWSQVKVIANIHLKDELKSFNNDFKKLEQEMIPLVYELGFIKR
ncbi:MAG: hypothetical protein E6X34_13355 [Clostridium sp.]|uniref:hypothetical protein n=1 Tax=Clostridium sp. TaxID=1506 RepID=UPI00291221B8|nr:hypothetical protein [Clostridium sp.]MDU4939436.1 hypothetical protein [Clostridium sp.]